MNPFLPEDDVTVWSVTGTNTRKAQHIRRVPRVCLCYADHIKATGYVAFTGMAVLVDGTGEILKRRRAYWNQALPRRKNLVHTKVIPGQVDALNYRQGALADPVTWLAALRGGDS